MLAVAAVQLDGVEPAVLAANVEDAVDDGRARVPVVVPKSIDVERVHRPDLTCRFAIECDDPELVVPGAEVEQRIPVGVDAAPNPLIKSSATKGSLVGSPVVAVEEMNRTVVAAE